MSSTDLDLLRKLANQPNGWEERNQTLRRLLASTPKEKYMALALRYVKLYLPHFKHKHPHDVWIDLKIEVIRNTISSSSPKVIPLFQEHRRSYPDATSRGFIKRSLFSLWEMTRHQNNEDACLEHAQEVISSVLTIVRNEYDAGLPDTLHFFDKGESYEQFKANLWLNLADEIEGTISK